MNTALISTKPSFLKDSEDNNLDVSAASYLGGSGGDSATAVDISLDGKTVIIGGKTPNHSPGGQQFSLIGGGDGLIMRYDSRTNQVLSSTRLPGQVRDLEVNPQTGEIAIAYGSGIALLSADASKVIWSKSLVNAERIAVSGKGNVTVLQENASGSTDIVTLYSQSGESLQTWSTSGSRYFQDVAISDQDGGAVVITGFKQARTDLQVAFTQAWAYDGKARWTAYDHSAQAVDAVNLLADTRGERIAFGRDGKLYSANSINGGTGYSIFSREPANLSQKASSKTVVTDKYTNAYLTGRVAMTWFGEYDLKTGGLVKGQGLLTRLSNGSGNSITPDAITADEQGNIYLSGKASARLENRDNQRIEGQQVSGYEASDGFLAIISPDLKTRYAWTPISKAQETAVAVRGGVAAVVATTNFEGTQITDNPIQSRAGGGEDGYFLILGGQDVPVGSSPIPAPAPGPSNIAPKAVNDSATTVAAQAVQINVLSNDSDADGDPLTVSGFSQSASGGSVSLNSNKTLTYTPSASFSGSDSFSYSVSDGKGGTDTATVAVQVSPASPPPTNGGSKIRLEAESLTLQNYVRENLDFASGGVSARLPGGSGTITTTLGQNFSAGLYNIAVTYFDENDGRSQMEMRVGGQLVDSWVLDKDPNVAAGYVTVQRTVATSQRLAAGTTIELKGTKNNSEFARVDYIELARVGDAPPPTPSPESGSNLNGTQFADRLIGNSSSNVLRGKDGQDQLTGGGGPDIFDYKKPTQGIDIITDFGGDDIFRISAARFGGGLINNMRLDSSSFILGSNPVATASSATFLYNTSNDTLSFDRDGTGNTTALGIARLTNGYQLQSSQIDIVA